MNRRRFHLQVATILAGATPLLGRSQQKNTGLAPDAWAGIERGAGGRLGVAVLQPDGQVQGHRLDERFPMCSTFKWLAAAYVLHRVDAGQERLDRRLPIEAGALLPHSPVTSKHVGAAGMTLAELCHATITVSDNAAANIILATYGGPQGLTGYIRGLGDTVTRMDRTEPALNESRPGDPRDTTTPRAMARLLHTLLLGDALSPGSRAQLASWMEATETSGQRLRADLPAGWRLGSKTGTGARGSTNDVGIFWPPGGAKPILVAAYLTDTSAPEAARNGAIAAVAKRVTAAR